MNVTYENIDLTEKLIHFISLSKINRLQFVIDFSWQIFFKRLVSGRLNINKEASMQLHYSYILHQMGDLLCIESKELFDIQMEHSYKKKNIDIICSYDDIKAAIELKCFKKKSNRATDVDMYSVLQDIERLTSYEDFQIKTFICITDNKYYAFGKHTGHGDSVSIKDGKCYSAGKIEPTWKDIWKDKSKNKDITLKKDIAFKWENEDDWYYLTLNL